MSFFTPFAFVKSVDGLVLPISASGGTESTSGSFSYNFFGSNGTLTVHRGGLVDILAVGGGGGGSSGGGGGGTVVYVSQYNLPAGSYSITRGVAGSGQDNDTANGASGSATTLVSGSTILRAGGGGGGAKDNNNGDPMTGGGSGGGAGASGFAPFPKLGGSADTGSFFTPSGSADSVNIYSNAGGSTLQAGPDFPAAGGGGAGAAGQSQFITGSDTGSGAGGDGIGIANWSNFGELSGGLNYFAGGGGGRRSDGLTTYSAPGGLGGGGAGAAGSAGNDPQTSPGLPNTGGGSGGNAGGSSVPQTGGTGVFIIRYITNP
jgi:hypothetical protein